MNELFPLDRPELRAGLAAGLVALAIGVLAQAAPRAVGVRRVPRAGGVLVVAAACAALAERGLLPSGLVPALVLLSIGGAAARSHGRWVGAAVLLAPGSVLLAAATGGRHAPYPQLVAAAIASGGGWLAADFDAHMRRGPGPVLFAVSAYAAYAVVPETDAALTLVGAALPLALLGWPASLDGLGTTGAFAACGVLGWVVGHGGAARPSALVGGVGALGLLALEPLVRALARRRASPLDALPPGRALVPVAAACHAAVVLVTARLAGTRRATWAALAVAVVGATVAVRLGLGVLRRIPSRRR